MFFKKKEDESKLPDLLPLRTPIRDEWKGKNDAEVNSLPSFPNSPRYNKFSQAAIKGAVEDEDEEDREELKEWSPSKDEDEEALPVLRSDFDSEKMKMQTMPKRKGFEKNMMEPRNAPDGVSDIFIRIDKFHSAKKSLFELQTKLEEIDQMIKKIRDIKMREEQELTSWENDLNHVKARIQDISANIFEKTD